MSKYIFLAVPLLLTTPPMHAAELSVLQGGSIDIGSYHGVVFFTEGGDGYRVVATVANGDAGLPIRFEATLTESQKMSIIVPGRLGEQSHVVVISRSGNGLVIAPLPASGGELTLAAPSSASP